MAAQELAAGLGSEGGEYAVFISHSRRNGTATTIAESLHNSLTSMGLRVWLDVKSERGGGSD